MKLSISIELTIQNLLTYSINQNVGVLINIYIFY